MNIRKIAFSFILFAFACIAEGQNIDKSLQLRNLKVEKQGDSIFVHFIAEIAEDATKSNYKLTLIPTLRKEQNQGKLSPIIVRNRRVQILDERNGADTLREAYTVRNGKSVTYVRHLPYESWMQGASLYIEGTSAGCCNSKELEPLLVAQNLVNPKVCPQTDSIGEEHGTGQSAPLVAPISESAKLIADFPFVAPISSYANVSEKDIILTRDKNVIVYYRLNESAIDLSYKENGTELERVIAAINQIEASNQVRLSKVVVIGFASPEGPTHINQKLAKERANSLVNYIISRSHISRSFFDVHNGTVAWRKLREYVANSTMPDREAVLAIIDHTPVWNATTQVGRLTKLRQLSNGRPYTYMKEHFFPLLRTAGVIKVYFEPI